MCSLSQVKSYFFLCSCSITSIPFYFSPIVGILVPAYKKKQKNSENITSSCDIKTCQLTANSIYNSGPIRSRVSVMSRCVLGGAMEGCVSILYDIHTMKDLTTHFSQYFPIIKQCMSICSHTDLLAQSISRENHTHLLYLTSHRYYPSRSWKWKLEANSTLYSNGGRNS